MPDLSPRNASVVRQGNANLRQLCEFASDILTSHNQVAQQTNASPVGETPAPAAPTNLKVVAGGGIIHATWGDGSQFYRGKEYHAEVIPDGGDWNTQAHPILSGGPARAVRANIGSGRYRLRVCADHPTSGASQWIYHPDVIDATGSAAPSFPKTTGTGTGGGGYGQIPYIGTTPPKRQ